MSTDGLGEVFAQEIARLYDAEVQLVAALPRMAAAIGDGRLREALVAHTGQTRTHVERLRRIVQTCGLEVAATRCEGMAGLLLEGEHVVRVPQPGVRGETALIAAMRRIEHYEIAAYEAAWAMADELGLRDACELLGETLADEHDAESSLVRIARDGGRGSAPTPH